jgi:hypothetical protein
MKMKKWARVSYGMVILLGLQLSIQSAPPIPTNGKKEIIQSRIALQLEQLRRLLNDNQAKFKDPIFLNKVLDFLRVLVPLAVLSGIAMGAYLESLLQSPFFIAEATPPAPSYHASEFYDKIKKLTPNAITYLDTLIPALEKQTGMHASQVSIHGHTLLSAAIEAALLDDVNKVLTIERLRGYGVVPTAADHHKAKATHSPMVINALK